MDMYRYQVRGRSLTIPGRVIRLTVVAANADDARRIAAIRDADFGPTVQSPRRVGLVVEPEQADGMTQAKARDDMAEGVAHFDWHGHDIEVEVAP